MFYCYERCSLKIKQPIVLNPSDFESVRFFLFVLHLFYRCSVFLRKEVIQPHLPIRLPCYDFTPIIDPTVGGFLLCRLDHRLRVLPTFVV